MKKHLTIGVVTLYFCVSVFQIISMDRLVVAKKETKKQFIERTKKLDKVLAADDFSASVWDPCNNRKVYIKTESVSTDGKIVTFPVVELRDWQDQTYFRKYLPIYQDGCRYKIFGLSADGKKVAAIEEHSDKVVDVVSYKLDVWKITSKKDPKLLRKFNLYTNENGLIPYSIGFDLQGRRIIVRGAIAGSIENDKKQEAYLIFKLKS